VEGRRKNKRKIKGSGVRSAAGWLDEFVKKTPKMKPNSFLSKIAHNFFPRKRLSKRMSDTFVIFEKSAQKERIAQQAKINPIWWPPCSTARMQL
jgi:hypothetical protein